MKTGAIILAAGQPNRTNLFVPLMCVGDKPVLLHLVQLLQDAHAAPVAVVAGYRADQVQRALEDEKVILLRNYGFHSQDMLSSLQLGLKALSGKCDRVLILPADLPLVLPRTLRQLLSSSCDLVIPTCGGRPGHPILIGKALFPSVLQYHGPDGLRGAIDAAGITPEYLAVDDEAVLLDANTEEDFRLLQALNAKRAGKGRLHFQGNYQLAVDDVILDRQLVQVLSLLRFTRSLQLSCEYSGTSYAKIWAQVKKLESQLGHPVVRSTVGGQKGGGTVLTEYGELLVERFLLFQQEADRLLNMLYRDHFDDFV